MWYITKHESEIIALLSKVGCIKSSQLKSFIDFSHINYDATIAYLVKKRLIKTAEDNELIALPAATFDTNIIKAIDVILFFKEKMDWFIKSDYPFLFSFYMNNSLFDITVINNNPSPLDIININNSSSNKVIAIVDDISIKDKINITKEVRFCTLNPITFYKK